MKYTRYEDILEKYSEENKGDLTYRAIKNCNFHFNREIDEINRSIIKLCLILTLISALGIILSIKRMSAYLAVIPILLSVVYFIYKKLKQTKALYKVKGYLLETIVEYDGSVTNRILCCEWPDKLKEEYGCRTDLDSRFIRCLYPIVLNRYNNERFYRLNLSDVYTPVATGFDGNNLAKKLFKLQADFDKKRLTGLTKEQALELLSNGIIFATKDQFEYFRDFAGLVRNEITDSVYQLVMNQYDSLSEHPEFTGINK